MGILKRKKSAEQNYKLTPFYMITASFQTKNCSDFAPLIHTNILNVHNYAQTQIYKHLSTSLQDIYL